LTSFFFATKLKEAKLTLFRKTNEKTNVANQIKVKGTICIVNQLRD
jgi:hypothetical protein